MSEIFLFSHRFLLVYVVTLIIYEIHGFNLDCDFFETSGSMGWDFISFGKRCETINVSITTDDQTVTSVNGQSGKFYHDQNVTAFLVAHQTLHYLPKGLEEMFPQLQEIYIENSKLKLIRKQDIEKFKALKSLLIQWNEIEELGKDLFESQREIRGLSFRQNKIKFIEEGIFDPLDKLEHLWLGNNTCVNEVADNKEEIPAVLLKVKSLCSAPPYVPTSTPRNLEQRTETPTLSVNALSTKYKSCDGNLEAAAKIWLTLMKKNEAANISLPDAFDAPIKITLSCKNGDMGECKVEGLKVTFPNTIIEQANQENGNPFDENALKLTIEVQQTLFLPTNIGTIFPNITELSVIASGLFAISPNVFENLKNLKSLIMTDNKMRELPSKVFAALAEALENLALPFNKIEIIAHDAFAGLKNLLTLKLNDNIIVAIDGKLFKDLVKLVELFLQNNKLKFIAASCLSPMVQLTLADLSNNECISVSYPTQTLADIKEMLIGSCIAPIELKCFLADDQICLTEMTTLSGYMCRAHDLVIEHPNTKILKVNGDRTSHFEITNVKVFASIDQQMNFFPQELAKFLSNVEKIMIERSKLSFIGQHDFKDFSELKWISIRYNNLTSIAEGTFYNLTQLEYIDLSHNNIQSLPAGIFSTLLQLKTLILSNNGIAELVSNFLPPKNSIQEIRVVSNNLKLIDTQFLKYLKQSKVIDFTNNECIGMKFDRNDKSGKLFAELFTEINLNCTSDD